MPSFSEREGHKPKKIMQVNSMDDELRTNLFSVIRGFEEQYMDDHNSGLNMIYQYIWCYFLHLSYDDFYSYSSNRSTIIKYYNDLKWFHVCDFIEFYLRMLNIKHDFYIDGLTKNINIIFEIHNFGYRVVKLKVIPITNEMEMASIVEAAETGSKAINTHMNKAIEEFSKKEQAINYASVIHSSISAVEATVNHILKGKYKTLGDALREFDKQHSLHPAMKEAFNKLYGYTSDPNTGIRHAFCEDAKHPPSFEEAKYMIVACSAFINYLMQKYKK